MPLDGPGCGVRDHTPDCLCDVHVVEPVSMMENWATESFMIRRLVEMMGPDTLHNRTSLFELLVRQVDLHEDALAYRTEFASNPRARLFDDDKLSGGIRTAIRQMGDARISNAKIREHLSERYQVDATYGEVASVIDSHRRTKRKRNRK